MELNMGELPGEDDISTERVGAGGIPAELVVAPEAQDGRVMLYLHGGDYVFGSTRTHRAMAAGISRAAKSRVLSLDYRLAPECPFPAAVDDSIAAYRWLFGSGFDSKKIVIGGDSASGGLMVAALVALRYLGRADASGGCRYIRMDRDGGYRRVFHLQLGSGPTTNPRRDTGYR